MIRGFIPACLAVLSCLSCSVTDSKVADDGGTTEITNAMVDGIVYKRIKCGSDTSVAPAGGSVVRLVPMQALPPLVPTAYDSAIADSAGRFRIQEIDSGRYNLLIASGDTAAAIVTPINMDKPDTVQVCDTLDAAAILDGMLVVDTAKSVIHTIIFIAGTPFFAQPDSAGAFMMTGLPSARLVIAFAYEQNDTPGIQPSELLDTTVAIEMSSGGTTRMDTIFIGPHADTVAANRLPSFTVNAADMKASISVGSLYVDTVHAGDPDGDTLHYSLLQSRPGMALTDSIFTWTPADADTGVRQVVMSVDDAKGGSDTLQWVITVADTHTVLPDVHQGMKLVPGGVFNMGSAAGDEAPVHSVTLDSFWMDSTEVTGEEYESVTGTRPIIWEYTYLDYKTMPACGIEWHEAVLYCNARSRKAGLDTVYSYVLVLKQMPMLSGLIRRDSVAGYRLPTEAEWEYACRAGSGKPYYWNKASETTTNNDTANAYAWFSYNTITATIGGGTTSAPRPVAQKRPNGWGLYDMIGNAVEWCNDWYDAAYYSKSPAANPTGPATGSKWVLRGGNFICTLPLLCSSTRFSCGYPTIDSTYLYTTTGFRTVLQDR